MDARLRHGELVDTVVGMEPDAWLFVLGEHRDPAASAAPGLHLDHRVEQVIRAVKRPVLVVTRAEFKAPGRFVLAWDGSPTARTAVERVALSPMLRGLTAVVVTAGSDETQARNLMDGAHGTLADAGFAVETAFLRGEPEVVLPEAVKSQGAGLLVMGAYGHSRLRSLIMGSTTTAMLRASDVPVLILRRGRRPCRRRENRAVESFKPALLSGCAVILQTLPGKELATVHKGEPLVRIGAKSTAANST